MPESVVLDPNVATLLDNASETEFHIVLAVDGDTGANLPVVINSPIEITISQDSTYTFDPAVILAEATDNEGDSITKVKVIETIDRGSLSYGTAEVSVINEDVLPFANYDQLKYTPIPGQSGANYAKMTLQFLDDGEVARCWSEDVVIIFHVVGENVEPTVDDFEIEVEFGSTTVLIVDYFTQNYYDPELDPLGFVIIRSIPPPSLGKLQLSAVDVTPADLPLIIPAATIVAGELLYIDNDTYIGPDISTEVVPIAKTIEIDFKVLDNVT